MSGSQRARNRTTTDPVDDRTVEDLSGKVVLDEEVERVGLIVLKREEQKFSFYRKRASSTTWK